MRTRRTLWQNEAEPILAIMIILIVLGLINVFSSSFVKATLENNSPYHYLTKQLVFIFVGLAVFVIARYINYHRWRHLMPIGVLVTIVALVIALLGPEINGARRWIDLKLFSIQPSELAKLMGIMLMAAALAARIHRNKPITPINIQMGIIIIFGLLTELEPDLGTASIIVGIPVLMIIVAGLSRYWLGAMGALGGGLLLLVMTLQPYRLARLSVWYDPWAEALDKGYQTVQSLSAIGSGGLWGMGLGDGVSKYDYLPEAHTDFAFAIFCQERGYVGAVLIFILFALLTYFCIRVAKEAEDEYGQLLAMGIMILVPGQGIFNLAMVAGLFPVVGVPLPFISYGGSSFMVTMAAMGILLNICDRSRKLRKKAAQTTSPLEAPPPVQPQRLHLVK